MSDAKYKILIVAGEASGDAHAAKLVGAMRDIAGEAKIEFFGCAGPKMRKAGVEAVVSADDLAIVGLPEIMKALPRFINARNSLKNAANDRNPDAVILVDFPEFNLKLAKTLKRKGLKVVYYISPQLWAWRKYRKRTIRKYVDLLLTILPFEKDWYAHNGIVNVEYIGSPLAREVHPNLTKSEFLAMHHVLDNRAIIALLPGSRAGEIARILPTMIESAVLMKEKDKSLMFIVAAGNEAGHAQINTILAGSRSAEGPLKDSLFVIQGETYDVLNSSDAAAVTSGTATLETGIIGTPMAIVYKASNFNYSLFRPMISVEHFGLINLIAGHRVAKEFIQHDFTPQALADELFRLLEPVENGLVRKRLHDASDRLGHGGASRRAAEAVFSVINESQR